MTDFQKIDKELSALGYTREKGMGDHYIYSRDGIPRKFCITQSLSHKGRAYKNCIAEIRRYEPGFLLGRPATSKSKKAAAASMLSDFQRFIRSLSEAELAAYEKYSHIAVGAKVRYTGAEKHDYSRLDDPASVMNIAYTVTRVSNGIGDCPDAADHTVFHDDDIVTVTDPQGNSSELFPSDLDSWELCRCCLCGRQMPENRFANEDAVPEVLTADAHGDVCGDCCRRAEALVRDVSQLDSPEALGAYCEKTGVWGPAQQPDVILNAVVWSRLAAVSPRSRTALVKNCFRRPFQELDDVTRKLLFAPEETRPERPAKPLKTKPAASNVTLLQVWKNACAAMREREHETETERLLNDVFASEGRVGNVPVLILEGEQCGDLLFQATVTWLTRSYLEDTGCNRSVLVELRCPNRQGQFFASYEKAAEMLEYVRRNGTKKAAGEKTAALSAIASLPPLEKAQELYDKMISGHANFTDMSKDVSVDGMYGVIATFRWDGDGVIAMPTFVMRCTDVSQSGADIDAICREAVSVEGFEHAVFLIADASQNTLMHLVYAERAGEGREEEEGGDGGAAECGGPYSDDVLLMTIGEGESPLDGKFDDGSPLGGFSVRELMRELRRRGVEFTESGVNVPVVTKQSFSFDDL